MSQAHQHWEEVWKAKDHEETSWFQPAPDTSLEILDFLGVSPESSLIDVGCGQSFLVDRLIERGFRDLHLLDVSGSALEAVKERLASLPPEVKVTCHPMDVLDLDPVPSVEVWHDRALLHFIGERADREWYAELALQAVVPGGFVVIAGFAPDGPEQCSNLDVCRIDAEGICDLFGENFQLIDSRDQSHRTPWDSEQKFQWTVLRRQ
ncbi:MAG: class I SAM-dependent methyltransferase [Phycisphaerales bacterium]|nr:class I SAM-dependent methyltransferase [Phycisphaerales bacterium]